MKKYVKPMLQVAATPLSSGATISCTVAADMEIVQSFINGADPDKVFGMYEACEEQVPLDMYCRFTSSELGAAQAFIS